MATEFRKRVIDELDRAGKFSRESLLVLGFSGGPDSLCLFDILVTAGFNVVAAHFDHSLRENSAVDAAWVAKEAARRGKQC